MKTLRATAAIGIVVLVAGCGSPAPMGPADETMSASVQLTVSSGAEIAGSVSICAERVDALDVPAPADPKYPCASVVPCTCFPLDADGAATVSVAPDGILSNGAETEPAAFADLCPSSNIPEAWWRFEYTLYSDGACGKGYELNDGGAASELICWDVSDLYDRSHPNTSYEYLLPGPNRNQILCHSPGDGLGQQAHLGTATGVYSGGTYQDTDPAHYYVNVGPTVTVYSETPSSVTTGLPDPAIDLEKFVSVDGGSGWIDADTPPGPTIGPCDAPMFKYVVTNTGNAVLSDVTVTDDVLGPIGGVGSLAPGAVVTFVAQGNPAVICP